MTTTDGSSGIYETRKSSITIRDGGVCVLCGEDPVDVAPIIADQGSQEVPFINNISPMLCSFRKDDALNLLSLCSLHHLQYESGFFVFVPSQTQRAVLLDHELRDFARRESLVQNNQADPGRTIPRIADEIEYIPVQPRGFRATIHNPTRYDQEMFVFDTVDHHPCPLLHFQASPICLMVQAQPRLAHFMRLKSTKADVAELEVTRLLNLYLRHPGRRENLVTVPASYSRVASMILLPDTCSSSHVLPSTPNLPSSASASAPSMGHGFDLHLEGPGLRPSSSTSAVGADLDLEGCGPAPVSFATAPEDTGVDPDMHAQADPELLEYRKERAVTWNDLKTRPPLFPGEGGGEWQFSCAEQIIRGEWR